ncbi:hypothetical protein BpJC7_32030 [Weizmannia acidilactici]|uniref:Uncharacterized protein n=1 Tax=Weizmannia acidilactici TaxID=2607726 RepID=A0A5J4JML4_9BACI|nr:hypothetical protein [Weizmannia acidilactici]GER68676.1 hypothetical protein BpJC4_31470 [Weizmannia acidilactici]GER71900.1 hypothetical protein BpJC7_32030 [Weizmannia acidilactici]
MKLELVNRLLETEMRISYKYSFGFIDEKYLKSGAHIPGLTTFGIAPYPGKQAKRGSQKRAKSLTV